VEPDYFPDAEVLCFQPCLYPMKYLHPRSMYTLPRGGVQRFFVDTFKEKYYPIGNYDDQYMRWTTLWKERGKKVSEFTNNFHTLSTNMGIKDSERHPVLKYHRLYIGTSKPKWIS
jgi:hypothetical protein